MINLEEEARKRRERLRGTSSTANQAAELPPSETFNDKKRHILSEVEAESVEEFTVPEDQVIVDESGAEILGYDTK